MSKSGWSRALWSVSSGAVCALVAAFLAVAGFALVIGGGGGADVLLLLLVLPAVRCVVVGVGGALGGTLCSGMSGGGPNVTSVALLTVG